MTEPAFVPGLDLCRRFFAEAIEPLLAAQFPGLPLSAGLLGPGSDVLGYDDAMSTDHGWCPRAVVLLAEQDKERAAAILQLLRDRLPHRFLGYAVSTTPDFLMDFESTGPVNHRVDVTTLREFSIQRLGRDAQAGLSAEDWLTVSPQSLLEVTAGAVFRDDTGELTAFRERLAYYPRDVWLKLLARGWSGIDDKQHLMGRAGYVGDELGSAVLGSLMVRDAMDLAFLMERKYAPYAKWFGTAFSRLVCAAELGPPLWRAQVAQRWQEREAALCEAFEVLARMHNRLGLTEPLPEKVVPFFGRPFRVSGADAFARALRARAESARLRRG